MHPGMMYWWKYGRRHHGDCGVWTGYGLSAHARRWEQSAAPGERHGDVGSGAFGVRRPLRFLAYKLDLDDDQIGELARILDELKTERAQAEVDARRTTAAFADVLGAETFDETRAAETAGQRTRSAERLATAVAKALGRLHTLLEPEQRAKLAYLIRTGALAI